MEKFRLTADFVEPYKDRKPPFGFGGLGALVYERTYSRIKEDGVNEQWWETIKRVVEGTYNMQKRHIELNGLGWNPQKAQRSAQEMYDRMWSMKFLPPGRGLWAMGSPITEERECFAALNNCGFVSTKGIAQDFAKPFLFLMDASMLGVGVGFDTLGAGLFTLRQPKSTLEPMIIPDSREGWVDSVGRLLMSYVKGGSSPIFDYSEIRAAGLPITGFGGVASGPEPLAQLHDNLRTLLDSSVGKPISKRLIVDIMNMIGKCVMAGNVRRSAEISLDTGIDLAYLQLKDYEANPERAAYGWSSNNSINLPVGSDYALPASFTVKNGEPGYVWLDNAKAYSRMDSNPDHKDEKAEGVNPCQPLWAPLMTPTGIHTLRDVNVGDMIWSEDGWVRVEAKECSGVKPVFSYRTTAGVFYGTDEHRIVQGGHKVEARKALAIDTLAGPKPCKTGSDFILIQDIMDGLVIGDGCLNTTTRGRMLLLHIGQDDQSYFDSCISPLIGDRYSNAEDETAYKIHTTLTPEELPNIPERNVPARFKADYVKMAGFLKGLYSANGCVIRTRVSLKTTSQYLRDDVQMMLSSLGIRSYYTTNKPTRVKFANGTYECRQSYDINIMTDRDKFAEIIGFIQPYKQKSLGAIVNKPTSKYANNVTKTTYAIIERMFLGEEEVFNIRVSGPNHTYWTGGLNVSNCGEQTLESFELCCLVETFPHRCDDLADYLRTLKFAYLYAKTVTLGKTTWPETNRILLRNRRIGCSMSGIVQFIATNGIHELRRWCIEGYNTVGSYDKTYSNWLCIPKSIKTTSIKPSGTVSLLAGATPGLHYPESLWYIRRVRLAKDSPLIAPLIKAGYKVEPCVGQEASTVVVEVPVQIEEHGRTLKQVTMWEQLELAAFMQRYWADNQVSVTVTFDPETEGDCIERALNFYQYRLKGVSFLPRTLKGTFPQMPYEEVTQEEYNRLAAGIKPLNFNKVKESKAVIERFCDSESCQLEE